MAKIIDRFGTLKVSDKVYISVFSFAAVFLFLLCQTPMYTLLFLLPAFLHELSHLIFLSVFGAKIKRITIFPFGVDILADTSLLSYKKELICTLSGSLANLSISAVCCLLLNISPSPELLFFAVTNAFLGTMNLIPLSFFDGGKALRLVLYDLLEIDSAFYIYRFLDMFSALIFLGFSLFVMLFSDLNFSVCAIILYASISTFALYIKNPCREH